LDEQPISIELSGPEQGRTRIDPGGTTVRIATDADAARFEDDLLTTLNGGAEPPEPRSPRLRSWRTSGPSRRQQER
jgi:hypothetical protein